MSCRNRFKAVPPFIAKTGDSKTASATSNSNWTVRVVSGPVFYRKKWWSPPRQTSTVLHATCSPGITLARQASRSSCSAMSLHRTVLRPCKADWANCFHRHFSHQSPTKKEPPGPDRTAPIGRADWVVWSWGGSCGSWRTLACPSFQTLAQAHRQRPARRRPVLVLGRQVLRLSAIRVELFHHGQPFFF